MSWFKKIINIFRDREVEYEDHEITDIDSLRDTNEETKGRDLEAKIAYQYPKGNFRFPLVIDGEQKKSQKNHEVRNPDSSLDRRLTGNEQEMDNRKRLENAKIRQKSRVLSQEQQERSEISQQFNRRQVREQTQSNRIRSTREETQSNRIRSTREQTQPDKKRSINETAEQTRSKISKKSSRPFRPTEIPSPIYGYTKRPDQTEVVEFELKSDSELFKKENQAAQMNLDIEAIVEEITYKNEIVEQTIPSDHLEEEATNENIPIPVTVEIEEETVSLVENPMDQSQTIHDDEHEVDLKPIIPNEFEDAESPIIPEEFEDAESPIIPEEFETAESPIIPEEFEDAESPIISEEFEDAESPIISEEFENAESLIIPEEFEDAESPIISEEFVTAESPIIPEEFEDAESPIISEEFEDAENSIIPEEFEDAENPTVHNQIEINQNQTNPDQLVVEEVHVVQNETEQDKPIQRNHLPFNVMMLKQDKRYLEQKTETVQKGFHSPQEKVLKTEMEMVIDKNEPPTTSPIDTGYTFPGFDLLNPPVTRFAQENVEWVENQEYLLNEALKSFGVRASVVNRTQGPSVTRFEVQPEPGVKVNKITNLTDDIKLSLAAKDIRIEAPIPGKHTIGIEVPNKKSRPVLISEIIKSDAFLTSKSPLTAVLGLDISGAPIVTDLKKMPHGLIAGATGSGKSVCINSILISLLYKASPHELKLLLIDPKMVELAPYNHIPHLVSPVITDVKAATAALKWAVDEMERRYELFVHAGVRDINRFNEIAEEYKRYSEKLPFIVIIIDELADLMMMSPADVEESICRIAQKARACGIHLIIATQRPSVDVITGLIKANVPTRTAFSVSSQIDSRTIIDISGAEKLLGRGDMLFLENGSSKPVRLQGTFVSDAEIDLVVDHVRKQQNPEYLFHQEELLKKAQAIEEEDELFYEACEFVIDQGGASTSSLQRRFKVGYNRAARLIDMMEKQGYISEPKGSKPRDILITEEELGQIQETTSSTIL